MHPDVLMAMSDVLMVVIVIAIELHPHGGEIHGTCVGDLVRTLFPRPCLSEVRALSEEIESRESISRYGRCRRRLNPAKN